MRGRSEALQAQLEAAVAATAAARAYFRSPSQASLDVCAQARRRERAAAAGVKDLFRPRAAPGRSDWLALSRAFAELAEQSASAAAEACRFGSETDRLARMAGQLWRAAQALEAAFGEREPARAVERLVEAKKRALDIERMRRNLRAEAIDDPRLVRELTLTSLAERFSKAADAVQRAADRMGELVAA